MNPALRDLILQSTAFLPTDIPGLALWLDAADASTFTLDGSGNVSEWRDKSGNGRHMAQPATLLMPAYGTQTQNGLPLVVTNAASGTRMQTGSVATTAWWGTGRQTSTVFRVIQYVSGTVDGGYHDNIFVNTLLFRPTAINQFRHGGFNDDANGGYGSTLYTGNADLTVHEIDLSVPTVRVRRNKSLFATLTPGATTAFSSGANQFYRIGWDAASVTAYYGEHLHFNRILTSAEIAQVEDYLTSKWGLP